MVKYCYIKTVLQSHEFGVANKEVNKMLNLSKKTLPELFLLGNFYFYSSAIFIVELAVTVCHFLMMQEKTDLSKDYIHLSLVLVVCLFFCLEIVVHYMNTITVTGDTILMLYAADL